MAVLAACAAEIDSNTRFTRYRGDGWQLCLDTPGHCLWACLYIFAKLQIEGTLSTRIAVGIGDAFPMHSKDLSTALGPAFTASGRALEAMRHGQRLALAGEGVDDFRRLAFAFAEEYAARWSWEQAQAMAMALSPVEPEPTQDDIAKALGITRQAVGSRLRAAGNSMLQRTSCAFVEAYEMQVPA